MTLARTTMVDAAIFVLEALVVLNARVQTKVTLCWQIATKCASQPPITVRGARLFVRMASVCPRRGFVTAMTTVMTTPTKIQATVVSKFWA